MPGVSTTIWFWHEPEGSPRAWLPDYGMILDFAAEDFPSPLLTPEKLTALRDRHVLSIDSEDIYSISVRTAESPSQTVRRDASGAWVQGPDTPPGFVPDGAAADAIAATLASLDAALVVSLSGTDSAALGLLPPRSELIVTRKSSSSVATPPDSASDAPVAVVQLGTPLADGSVPLRVKGLDAVFALDPETAGILEKPVLQSNQTRPQ